VTYQGRYCHLVIKGGNSSPWYVRRPRTHCTVRMVGKETQPSEWFLARLCGRRMVGKETQPSDCPPWLYGGERNPTQQLGLVSVAVGGTRMVGKETQPSESNHLSFCMVGKETQPSSRGMVFNCRGILSRFLQYTDCSYNNNNKGHVLCLLKEQISISESVGEP